MRSSSSELLLDQQQELRRKKLLELVAPKKKKAPKRTCRQRVWFYTTSIVALTAVSAGSSLLFLVPLYVDPAISTLVADFTESPVTCITTRREDHSGIFNCSWSSCREGCTSDMYKCTHIYVSYFASLVSTPTYEDSQSPAANGSGEGVLLVNIKGCGYPPEVNCGQFTATYGIEGAEFPCHFSRENRTVVMTHYDRDDQIQIIINFFAVPFIITVVSSVVLCIMHYDCQCSGRSTRRRRPRIENASKMEDFHRNLLISGLCGVLFGLAWWMMIDILALYPEVSSFKHGLFYLPIFLSTASLFINSIIPNSSLVEHNPVTKMIFVHRLIFFLSMTLGFSGLLASIIICVLKDASRLPTYSLVGIPVLNALILIANLTFKFGVVDESDELL